MKSFFPIFLIFFVCLAGPADNAYSTDNLAAKGQDFVITMDFARKVADFNQKRSNIRPTPEELVRSGVEHWLFAREAVIIGLANPEEDIDDMEPVEVVTLHNMYLIHRLMQIAPDEKTLRSYYKAFPARFKIRQVDSEQEELSAQDESSDQSETVEDDLENDQPNADKEEIEMVWIPFEDVKDDIRRTLLSGKRTQVRMAAFEDLVEKYDVRIFN